MTERCSAPARLITPARLRHTSKRVSTLCCAAAGVRGVCTAGPAAAVVGKRLLARSRWQRQEQGAAWWCVPVLVVGA